MAYRPSKVRGEVLALLQMPFSDAPPLTRQARFFTIFALACLTIAVYWQSFGALFSLYVRSDYQHHLLVYPVALYLIWRRQRALVAAPAGASAVGVLILAGMAFAWLIAKAASVQTVEHGLAIMMIPAFIYAVMGAQVMRVVALPLTLLFAAIPLGDVFFSVLMEVTTDISSFLLNLVGIPTYREGMFLSLPGGDFRVIEACAGLNYLSAGVTGALLFSCFAWTRWQPRAVFVSVAALVFILGNGIRAFIVMAVASATHMKVLAGHDHVIFGTILFTVLMLLLFWVGMKYAEKPGKAGTSAAATVSAETTYRKNSLPVAVAAFVALAAGPAAHAYRVHAGDSTSVALSLPAIPNCVGPAKWNASWSPTTVASNGEVRGSYRCGDVDVNVYAVEYINPEQGRELVSVGNIIVPREWSTKGERADGSLAVSGGKTLAVNEVTFVQAEQAEFATYWFDVNGRSARSEYAEKILEARTAVSLHPVHARAFVVSAAGPHLRPEAPRARAMDVARSLATSALQASP